MTCLWVLCAETTVICFAVMCERLCMHWQLDVNGFLQVATSLHYFVLSETLKCG